MNFKRLWLNLKWVFGYRAVFMREPSDRQLVLYAKMGRAVATKYCAVCGGEYWVIGNPKIKGHFSPVCGRRQCYLIYYGDWKSNPANRFKRPDKEGTRNREEIRQAARKVVARRVTAQALRDKTYKPRKGET